MNDDTLKSGIMSATYSDYEEKDEGKKDLAAKTVTAVLAVFIVGIALIAHFTSIDYLVSRLESSDPAKRKAAVEKIIRKGQEAGYATLSLALNKEADLEARRIAVFLLGEIRYEDAKKELLKLLKKSPPVIQGQAAYALGRLGDVKVMPSLTSAYRRAPKGVKIKILSALGELGDASAIGFLSRAAGDNKKAIRNAAASALNKIKIKNKL